jgi:hypothetical protein
MRCFWDGSDGLILEGQVLLALGPSAVQGVPGWVVVSRSPSSDLQAVDVCVATG